MQAWVISLLKKILPLFIILSSLYSVVVHSAYAQSTIPVEVTVPETKVNITGFASPLALVKVEKAGAVVASTLADNSGLYSVLFTSSAGVHNFTIYSTDSTSLQSAKQSFSLSVQSQQTTNVNKNIAPTISLGSKQTVQRGSVVKVYGYSVSNGDITLMLDHGSKNFSTKTNSRGYYEYFIDTEELIDGGHTVTAIAKKGGMTSGVSKKIDFSVLTTDKNSTPDIVVSPDIIAPPIVLIPEDGAIIQDNEVVIRGEAVPGAQINIYLDGLLYGSFFVGDDGKWSYTFQPTYSPVTLTFEACVDDKCSILSNSITLTFNSNVNKCAIKHELEEYRFWGILKNETLDLKLLNAFSGKITIDWGDENVEIFNHRNNSPLSFFYSYKSGGSYNGSITFEDGDCTITRYFSVRVINEEEQLYFYVAFLLLIGLIIGHYLSKKDNKENAE